MDHRVEDPVGHTSRDRTTAVHGPLGRAAGGAGRATRGCAQASLSAMVRCAGFEGHGAAVGEGTL
ncbi:hypothetical protein C3489_21110 [Streptomyces sp. Ru71]|nr:hypothetical protein C3489_21110 [Streptomyces sp. Ru71]